jgi:preprotein translocase subunit YajC
MLYAMAQPQGGNAEGGLISTLIMFSLIIGIFYFLILRPQQKRQKERKTLLEALKKGDKVVTSGGMYGTIAGLDDKTVLVQVAEGIKIKFERGAVNAVVREGEAPKETK